MHPGIAACGRLWQQYGAEVTAAIIAASAVPLAVGWVPMNSLYGFRTPLSMSSPEAWYRANELMGFYMLVAQVAAIVSKRAVVQALLVRWPQVGRQWGIVWVCALTLLGVLGSVAHFYLLG